MRAGISCFLLLLSGTVVFADTHVIYPDGSGDYPTIQAALASAVDGDVIELAPGIFQGPGNTDVDFLGKAVTVTSQGGADATAIDCAFGRGFLFQSLEGPASVLAGVTIQDGSAGQGGGIFIDGASPTIENCRFLACTASTVGGAIYHRGGTPTIDGCEFIECEAAERGGAIFSGNIWDDTDSDPTISDCLFRYCTAEIRGGALYISWSSATVTGCLFQENSSELGGAVALNNDTALFTWCTFYQNSADGGSGVWATRARGNPVLINCTFCSNDASSDNGVIYLNGGAFAELRNTIIAFNNGYAVYIAGGAAVLSCCDLYWNTSGDWTGEIAGQLGMAGNIQADPMFCDISVPELEINDVSPCAAGTHPNPECALIGAWGVNCTSTPVTATTWSEVKSRYNR